MMKRKGEPVSEIVNATMEKIGPKVMGVCAGYTWHDDPRRMVFMLSRYKFVAKMFAGSEHVLEVGCGDAFGTRIVAQAVKHVTGVDFDPTYIESARKTASKRWPITVFEHDILAAPVPGKFDAVFALDVLEHIEQAVEERFLANCLKGLVSHGVCIVGMPSLESQPYASAGARMGHVNCKEQPDLKTLMQKFFHNVFMFSANDEVIHTGYSKMAHYNLALCCGKRN
jgi:2-polyprenyl-3-methyl-5-hydroxy-6-metoxy-1,4-benzoquinol methylase